MPADGIVLLRIPPEAPIDWPADWPRKIGLIAKFSHRQLRTLMPYHESEDLNLAFERALDGEDRAQVHVEPPQPGWPEVDGDILRFDGAFHHVHEAVRGSEELLEHAYDFEMNYEYAISEGLSLRFLVNRLALHEELPGGDIPMHVAPEAQAPLVTAPLPHSLALRDARLVAGVEASVDSDGRVELSLPGGGGEWEPEAEMVDVLPSGGIALHLPADRPSPSRIRLPESATAFLFAEFAQGPLRVIATSQRMTVVALLPTSTPAPPEKPVPVLFRLGRWSLAAFGAVLMAALITTLSLKPWSSEPDPVAEMRRGLFGASQSH